MKKINQDKKKRLINAFQQNDSSILIIPDDNFEYKNFIKTRKKNLRSNPANYSEIRLN